MFFNSDIKRIVKSGLFDVEYYLQAYPEVRSVDVNPLKHFVKYGWKEGKNPSTGFDTNFYLATYPDVVLSGINPLIHYIKHGKQEGRKTHPTDPTTMQSSKISKLGKLISLGKYAKNNPHLIVRTINEVRLYGIKKTIKKIQNKSYKIEAYLSTMQKSTDLNQILDLFHLIPHIPKFTTNKPIDIIIPVYNGKEYLIPLFESIIKNTSMPYRLLVCDDKSSDTEVLPLLKSIKENHLSSNFVLLENEINLGFIKTVNKLAKLAENHFVLLNTDTEVPPYWIERLMYPIFEMDNIASTTPFTNAGSICSFPNYLEDNPIFENMSVEEIDKQFQYVNFEKTTIEIPTGVGFCMGVNKNLVDKIGMFDEIFGKGYCEENDWCQRAIEEGYKSLHVPNLFVYHKHGGSFHSDEKQQLINKNLQTLNKKHPSYAEQVDSLIAKNELSLLRNILAYRIQNSQNYSVLIFDHNLSGGAHDYITEDITERVNSSQTICLIRYDFNGTKQYIIELITRTEQLIFNTKSLDEISRLIQGIRSDEIFINSLVMYPDINGIVSLICDIKKRSSLKVIVPIHDFFSLCPSYTLLDETMKYCNIPTNFERCDKCLIKNKGEFKIFEKELDIRHWRKSWNELFEFTDEILCFSNSSKDIFIKAYPNFQNQIKVVPHDISGRYSKIYTPNEQNSQIRIGILGGINEAKGALVIKHLVEHIEKNNLNAKVILIGQISIPITSPCFEVSGKYDKTKLPEIVKEKNITQFLIPSIWPETFSYTTDEIMQMGYPLIVFNLGAPAERVKNYSLGTVIEIQDLHEVLFGN